ncbi:hypothetical protein B0H19DRAFT_1318406, partial [Mycena capillaripes]
RTLFSIISGCLATVFACTWVSVHPNVPPPNQSQLALTWRRFCLMLVAVVAPELMAGFAARQFLDARWFSKEYGVSRTHGFFFAMGGFVSCSGHHPIVTLKQLEQYPEYLAAIRSVKVRDIEDKSKGDAMSKGVVFLQGLWFTAQCLARVHQHLPLAELEVATIAFQFVNIFIWLLWWCKPLDVQQPILIGSGDESVADGPPREPLLTVIVGRVHSVVMGFSLAFKPEISTSIPSFCSPLSHLETRLLSITTGIQTTGIQVIVGTIFGAIHCAAWNTRFFSATEIWMWRFCSLTVAAIPILFEVAFISAVILHSQYRNFHFFRWESSHSVPSFWSTHGAHGSPKQDMQLLSLIMEALVGTVFGGIHCVAWNAHFPSSAELWMWRSCSLGVAVIPFLLAVTVIPSMRVFDYPESSPVSSTTLQIFFRSTGAIYIAARLILIVLPFTTLRYLAPGAFLDVN